MRKGQFGVRRFGVRRFGVRQCGIGRCGIGRCAERRPRGVAAVREEEENVRGFGRGDSAEERDASD